MITGLEIADTAIKVGLGAFLSGITTYFVTKSSHLHEIQKGLQNEKKELLKEALIKLEQCGSLLNETRQSVHRLLVGESRDKETKLVETIGVFTTAYNMAKTARSQCQMIGQKPLADVITRYVSLIEELRLHYVDRGFQYDVEFVNANTNKLSGQKDKILEQLAAAFDSIYAK
jgi:hypothetical protein